MKKINKTIFTLFVIFGLILSFSTLGFKDTTILSEKTQVKTSATTYYYSQGPQVPLGKPHTFYLKDYIREGQDNFDPTLPSGWASAADGNVNHYRYHAWLGVDGFEVVDIYYFDVVGPYEDLTLSDIVINFRLWAYLGNPTGHVDIQLRNFKEESWEMLEDNVQSFSSYLSFQFDSSDYEESDLTEYVNEYGQCAVMVYTWAQHWMQPIQFLWWTYYVQWPPKMEMRVDVATVEAIYESNYPIHLLSPNKASVSYDSNMNIEVKYETAAGIPSLSNIDYELREYPWGAVNNDAILPGGLLNAALLEDAFWDIQLTGYDSSGNIYKSKIAPFFVPDREISEGILGVPVDSIELTGNIGISIIARSQSDGMTYYDMVFSSLPSSPRTIVNEIKLLTDSIYPDWVYRNNKLKFEWIDTYVPLILIESEDYYEHRFLLKHSNSIDTTFSSDISMGYKLGGEKSYLGVNYASGSSTRHTTTISETWDVTASGGESVVVYLKLEFVHICGYIDLWFDGAFSTQYIDAMAFQYMSFSDKYTRRYPIGLKPFESPLTAKVAYKMDGTNNPKKVTLTDPDDNYNIDWQESKEFSTHSELKFSGQGSLNIKGVPMAFDFSASQSLLSITGDTMLLSHTFTRTTSGQDRRHLGGYNAFSTNLIPEDRYYE
ncbi:MAG: hypothetical protein JW891_04945 [Candidatus Lokiarchaeota archaeon]|nr:hypothetical protein [Candidatus Lokiarchaeota archaeon]